MAMQHTELANTAEQLPQCRRSKYTHSTTRGCPHGIQQGVRGAHVSDYTIEHLRPPGGPRGGPPGAVQIHSYEGNRRQG